MERDNSYTEVYPLELSQSMWGNSIEESPTIGGQSSAYILVLYAPSTSKQVPVIIGEAEAQAIVMAIEGRKALRPLTHNLISNIMEEFMLELKEVTIDRFFEGIFYSTLHISDGFSQKQIDSRTSDAVVMALHHHCPIWIHKQVLEETSMEPGALTDNLPKNKDTFTHDGESLQQLEQLLHECEEREDYEQAAIIMEKINRLKGKGEQK